MRSPKIYLVIITLALLPLAFTWFGQEKKKEEPKKQGSSGLQKSHEISKEDEGAEQTGVPEAKAVPVLPPLTPSVKPIRPITIYPTVQKVYKPIQKPIQVIPPPVPAAAPSIDRIRQQISDIIRINEELKMRNQGQIAEIQRISDQARVHQQILASLEATPSGEKKELKSSDAEAILKQEKIRLIGDETEKNHQLMDKLKKEKDSKSKKKAAS